MKWQVDVMMWHHHKLSSLVKNIFVDRWNGKLTKWHDVIRTAKFDLE
jgi:hypothetical protein